MQVTNNQPTTTNHPTGQAAEAGFGAVMTATTAATTTASAENEAAVMDPHRRAVLDGALANMETIMNAHGAPEMAPLAKRLLENAAEEMLDLPAHIFERNVMEMAPPHILHHLFARTGKIDDPNARERGPIDIPVLDENGGLTNLSLSFPDRMGIREHILHDQNEQRAIERQQQTEELALRHEVSDLKMQLDDQTQAQMRAHGASHLVAPAIWTISEGTREMRLNPDEFTKENMRIMQGYTVHHLLARDGIIDDSNAPTEGPIMVPQYLPDGTMHHVAVELLMERPQRDNA